MKDFKLDNYQKLSSGFTSPDEYFDDFSEKLLMQIQKEDAKVISIFSRRKNWFYGCAAILIMALSLPFVFQNKTNEIDTKVLENYLTINAGISDVELIDLLHEEDIKRIKINQHLDEKTVEDILISNSNFEQYIND